MKQSIITNAVERELTKTCKDSIWIGPSIELGLNLISPNNEFIERG